MDTKKLRQKILDLAIRGKLVPQDPNDEPASVLLERIRAEKERLIKEGKIKRSKKTASDDEIEAPFEIPESWEWVRLCDITVLIEDCPHSTAKDEGHGYPLIRTPNVGEGYLIFDGVHRVSESVYNKRNARAVPETNDIIYAREAPAGNAAVIKENEIVCLGQRTVLIRPFKKYINSKLLAFFIISPHSRNSLISTAVGSTATHVNLENIRPFNIPIPPLSEQKRIVNAVERWFTLINELESNEGDLLKAIDQAKFKILDLAIHGKLVPKDPNDEPAIDLLKRINPKFETFENEYDGNLIPEKWCFCHIGDIADIIGGVSYKKEDIKIKGIRVLRGGNIQDGIIVPAEDDVFIVDTYYNENNAVKKGDIVVVASTGSSVLIGKTGFATNDIPQTQIGAFLRLVRPNKQVLPNYLNALFLSDYYKTYIRNIAKGSNINNIKNSYLTDFVIALPPYQEQLRIVARIEELFAVLDSIKESLE